MSATTVQLRKAWARFECRPEAMVEVEFGPDRIRVAPGTEDAWRALAGVFEAHDYEVRVQDTDSYCCREIKGGSGRSLHAFGIALDVNWNTNPFKETPDNRPVRFSSGATRAARMDDVKHGRADTDMTPEMIADVRAICTPAGKQVFEWGGGWKTLKDAMHFEIDLAPEDLKDGIDWSTVKLPASDAISVRGAAASDADEADVVQTAGSVTATDPGGAFTPPRLPTGPQLQTLIDAFMGRLDASLKARAASPEGGSDAMGSLQHAMQTLDVLGKAMPSLTAPVTPAPASPTGTQPVLLSPIDKALGGEALAGKKTLLSIVAYIILQLLTIRTGDGGSVVEAGSTTYGVLQSLIMGFGGLGLLSKVDRVNQALTLIAEKPAGTTQTLQ